MTNVIENAEKALKMVRDAKELVYDTETSGLDWKRNFPIGYVIGSDPQNVVYVPIRHGGGGNLPDPKGLQAPKTPTDPIRLHPFEVELAKVFQERQGLTFGHNLKFDCHFSANAGVMLGRNLSCTQNTEALLDEYSKSFSLDACASTHGVQAKKGTELYEHMGRVFGIPANRNIMSRYWEMSGSDPVVAEYAVGDGVTTWELFQKQRKKIEDQDLQQVFELENDLIWTLFRMERRGVKVDTQYLGELLEEIDARVKTAYDALPSGFNVRSPIQVRKWVEEAGHTDWPTTEKGNPSFTEKWLKGFPAGQVLVDVRKWSNLANSFVRPLIEDHVFEGRVHASFNQLKADDHGTISGRLSCSNPNLQQIPKRDKELATKFRRAFMADEGMVFSEADWSQCEPRLFAHYSGEPAIVDGYNQHPFKDMHAVVAELLNVERDPTAKRMNMGILTGMFPKSFAVHMGWDLPTAVEKWDLWFKKFPAIRDFQDKAKGVLQSRGYVKTLLGRRGRLDKPQFAYKAVSKIIQGGNADIMKYKLVEIDKMLEAEGDRTHLLLTVHDSFGWQSPIGDKEVCARICAIMEDVQTDPFNLRVPFIAEHACGANWAEATFGPDSK